MFKSALPLALATSPLLLAAAQPPGLESMVGADCSLETWASDGQGAAQTDSAVANPTVAQPISNRNQALVTSEREMSAVSTESDAATPATLWGTALQLLLDNPYIAGSVQSPEDMPTSLAANQCISQHGLSTQLPVSVLSKANTGVLIAQIPDLSEDAGATTDAPSGELPSGEIPDETMGETADDTTGEPAPLPDLNSPAEGMPAEIPPAEAPPAEPAVTEPAPDEVPMDEPSADDQDSLLPPSNENPNNVTPGGGSPTPFDGTMATTLESLPDGNYRYLAGDAQERAYTNEELRERGGSLFLMTKKGDTITGDLMPRFGLPGICVTGTVSGNTVTGAAYPYDSTDSLQDSARDIGDTYEPHGSGSLQIRQTRSEGDGLYYAGALLDLSSYTLINAGSSLPPEECSVGRTGGRDQG